MFYSDQRYPEMNSFICVVFCSTVCKTPRKKMIFDKYNKSSGFFTIILTLISTIPEGDTKN